MKAATRPLPTPKQKTVTILGSTGTIGQNTLDIISVHPERFSLAALVARENVAALAEQAKRFRPKRAVIANAAHYEALKTALSGTGIEVAAGEKAVIDAAAMGADMVMSAIVGAAGLQPTLAAIHAGSSVALANKECLVCAGDLVMKEVAKHETVLLPVDSEHNAIFQLFDFEHPEWIESVTITASGGPFREWTLERMKTITPEQAVKHPNWTMGAKISVDSATMMNKGLEMIEALHLFPLKSDQVKALVHPQSVIHCLVQMHDGSVLAQMSNPDMRAPIAHALAWPERVSTSVKKLNLAEIATLTFEAPDENRFPALRLSREAWDTGGAAPCILNAANEVAVARFLAKTIGFLDIARIVEETLNKMNSNNPESIEEVLAIDREARIIAEELA